MINEVFCIGDVPNYTYVSRIERETGFPYEVRLSQATKIKGCPIILSGQKNCGKKTLCKKVFGVEKILEVKLTGMVAKEHFWKHIYAMGDPIEDREYNSSLVKRNTLEQLQGSNSILMIEGLELLSNEMKAYVAQQVKEVSRLGIRTILIMEEVEAKEVVQANPDLQGRISIIHIESWTIDELKQIALLGFKFLNRRVEDLIIDRMARESNGTPKMMQNLCREL